MSTGLQHRAFLCRTIVHRMAQRLALLRPMHLSFVIERAFPRSRQANCAQKKCNIFCQHAKNVRLWRWLPRSTCNGLAGGGKGTGPLEKANTGQANKKYQVDCERKFGQMCNISEFPISNFCDPGKENTRGMALLLDTCMFTPNRQEASSTYALRLTLPNPGIPRGTKQ